MSMLSQLCIVIIDHGISATGFVREVLDRLNTIDKRFILQLISTVQILGEKGYDTQIVIHTVNCTSDVSLARELKKYLLHASHKRGVIYQGRSKKGQLNEKG